MKKTTAYLTLVVLSTCISVNAQDNINNWYFGNNAGVYFDETGIHPTSGAIIAAEGTSSISDGCGLLFYTDGNNVWTKEHSLMQNGFDIGGKCSGYVNETSSSTQAALVVRQPASDSIFYIFTTDCIEDGLSDGMRYSIVNMNRNNGLGEVVTKKQLLFTHAEEKLTASKHANGCDIWIISHEYGSKNFYSYLLTSSGLNLVPIISTTGQIHNASNPTYFNARGYLKASPNGEKLINVNLDGVYSWADTTLPELFSFNKSTGNVASDFVFPQDSSNWWDIYDSWSIPFYGASFSPDNSKLYLSSGFYGPNLYQFDLTAGSPTAIIASQTCLSLYPYPADLFDVEIPTSLVNAPDGKMYVAQRWKGYLGAINSPNLPGVTCNYVDSAFALSPETTNDWGGLPNFFEDYINPKLLNAEFTFTESLGTVFFTNTSTDGSSFTWDFGDGNTSNSVNPTHVYSNPGMYNVSLIARDNSCDIDKYCMSIDVSQVNVDELHNALAFTVYPNPFSEMITIETSNKENLDFELYNILGEKIKTIKVLGADKTTIKVGEDLSSGIYYIQLANTTNSKKQLLVKL
jgi:PKD repeat protein